MASVFCTSLLKALVFVIDGSGEELGTSIWECSRDKLPVLIDKFELPDSLGYFYGAMTEFLGLLYSLVKGR